MGKGACGETIGRGVLVERHNGERVLVGRHNWERGTGGETEWGERCCWGDNWERGTGVETMGREVLVLTGNRREELVGTPDLIISVVTEKRRVNSVKLPLATRVPEQYCHQHGRE